MKRKKTTAVSNTNNGINITDSISLTINSKYWINPKLILMLISLVGSSGFALSVLSLYEFPCDTGLLLKAGILIFVLCSVFSIVPSKIRLILSLLCTPLLYFAPKIFRFLTNTYIDFFRIISAKIKSPITGDAEFIPPNIDDPDRLTLFLICLFTFSTLMICYNTIVKPRFFLVFSCTFPMIEIGLMFGHSPDHKYFAMLISYWIALFTMRIAGNQYHSSSDQPVFVRKNNIFVSSGNLKNNVIENIGIITLTSALAVMLISSLALNFFSYKRSEKINDTRHNVKTAISEFSIEKFTERITEEIEKNPISDRARLGNLSKISFKNKTDITILVSEKLDSGMYLRGFVGTEYANNTWYALSDETTEKNQSMFDKFGSLDMYPQYFNGTNDYLLMQEYPSLVKPLHMVVSTSFKTNPYLFTPYSTAPQSGIRPYRDNYLLAENMKDYSFTVYEVPSYYKNMELVYKNIDRFSENQDFYNAETSYREFVYDNYLFLPDRKEIRYLAENYPSIPRYDGSNIAQIYKEIKLILHDNAAYSLEPGKTPSDTELTYYLLTQNHKGYCSHFATAAAVLARIAGVPSRYVEGYVAVPSDIETAERVNTYYRINLMDSRAHAWTEFYIDGYGWIPFEFTPGYDSGVISAESHTSSPEATQTSIKPSPAPEQTTVQTETTTEAPVTSIAPTVSTEPLSEKAQTEVSITEADGSTEKDGEAKNGILSFIKVFASLLVSVLLIIALILARHIIQLRRRIKSFRCSSNNQSVSNVYKYTTELLKHISIVRGNMLPLDFAEYAEENVSDLCGEGKMTELIRLTLKSSFSNEEITNEELQSAISVAKSLAQNIYEGKSNYERLVFKYILNLL